MIGNDESTSNQKDQSVCLMPKGIMHYAVVRFPSHVNFFIRALPIKKKKNLSKTHFIIAKLISH